MPLVNGFVNIRKANDHCEGVPGGGAHGYVRFVGRRRLVGWSEHVFGR
jgi:hypothetical protein